MKPLAASSGGKGGKHGYKPGMRRFYGERGCNDNLSKGAILGAKGAMRK